MRPACRTSRRHHPTTRDICARCWAGRAISPNLWTDAWLAALALSLDLDLVSFDRGFRAFDGLRLTLLAA